MKRTRYVFIKRGESIPRGSQFRQRGKWVPYWNSANRYIPGIVNLIFNQRNLRRPLKSKAVRKPTNNRPPLPGIGHCAAEEHCGSTF
jgi:hypothetical protein